jgi:hypothetical protein
VWSRVIVRVAMLQLEDELLGKGQGSVRCQPIRVRFRDKIKCLLRGQVILSI